MICWYVDDNNIYHEDVEVVSSIIGIIEGKFGKMTKTMRDKHICLGMNVEFIGEGRVKSLMKEYLYESIVSFGEDLG